MAEVYAKILRIRLKPDLYEALAKVARAEGHSTLADWGRQQMVLALRRHGVTLPLVTDGQPDDISPVVSPSLSSPPGESESVLPVTVPESVPPPESVPRSPPSSSDTDDDLARLLDGMDFNVDG